MYRHFSWRLAFLLVLVVTPVAVHADAPATYTWAAAPGGSVTASVVDFDTWMQRVSLFTFGGSPVFGLVAPATADNNKNFILDATEFAIITAICNNTSHPLHDTVHEAFKKNNIRLGGQTTPTVIKADLGALTISLCHPIRFIMAAYATLGDGSYTSSGTGTTRTLDTAEGSWGIVAAVIEGAKSDGGSLWKDGAPIEANYERLQLPTPLLSACADTDGHAEA